MPISYHDGTATRTISELHYHDGSAVRRITEAWYHDGTEARKVWPASAPMAVTIYPEAMFTEGFTANITSGLVTATATGGSGSFTYQWYVTAGTGVNIGSPTASTTSFTATNMQYNTIRAATAQCVVRDTVSGEQRTVTVELQFTRSIN